MLVIHGSVEGALRKKNEGVCTIYRVQSMEAAFGRVLHGISAEFGKSQRFQWDQVGITRSVVLSTFSADNKPTSSICGPCFVWVCKKLSKWLLTRSRAKKR